MAIQGSRRLSATQQQVWEILRTPDALYETRLACCRDCEALQNGTCMQCGCYVEMRAARSDMHCPLTEPRW